MNISEEEEKNIIEDYTKNKICIAKLVKKYHHNQRNIINILDKYNINHKRGVLRAGISNEACKRILTEEELEIIKNIYTNEGTTKDCIAAVHCNQNVLREALKNMGLYKSRIDVKKELPQNQRKYIVNDNFFLTQSSNMAYLLGFIASDGYISKDKNEISIGLSSIDKELLEQFKEEIGGRNLDNYITSNGYQVTKWTFTSQIAKQELSKYNIIPEKTFKLKPPHNLKKEYWIDYIRGYFDGDGSVNIISNKALRWQICSATPEILQWIIDFLYEEYNIPKVNILIDKREVRKHPLYYFQYSTNATKNIYNILYTNNSWFLQRKKDKFEEILKKK